MLPPSLLLDLHRPPATPMVYDIPPVISYRPSYRPFRALAALLTWTRSHASISFHRRPARTNTSSEQPLSER
jgi:hypothetical protein